MPDHSQWMRHALELADQARDLGEVPVGAVLVRDEKIIGRGFNQTISSVDPTAHAEIMCLRDAAKQTGNHRLIDSDLYVTIEPCTMCAGALVHARIKRLVYGAAEPRAGAVDSTIQVFGNTALNHKIEVISNVCDTEAAHKMSAFFKARRK